MDKKGKRTLTRFDIKREQTTPKFFGLGIRTSGATVRLSSNGGPFLVYKETNPQNKLVFNEPKLKDQVLVFKANGQLLRKIGLSRPDLIHAGFLQNKQVMLLFKSGYLQTWDIYSHFQTKEGSIQLKNKGFSEIREKQNRKVAAKGKIGKTPLNGQPNQLENQDQVFEIQQALICGNSVAFVTMSEEIYILNDVLVSFEASRVIKHIYSIEEQDAQFLNVESQMRFSKFAESDFVILGKSKIRSKQKSKAAVKSRISQLLYDQKDCKVWAFFVDPGEGSGKARYIMFPHIEEGIHSIHWNGKRAVVKHHLQRTKGRVMMLRMSQKKTKLAILTMFMSVEFYAVKNLRKGQYTHVNTIELTQTWIDSNRFKSFYWLNEDILGFLNVNDIRFLVLGQDDQPQELPGSGGQKKESTDRLFCLQEEDGLRVLSVNFQRASGSNCVFRIESEAELKVQSISSTDVGRQLVDWFRAEKGVLKKDMLLEDELWKRQADLVQGIHTLFEAIEYKQDLEKMKKLIKVVQYVKNFLREEEQEQKVGEKMKKLLLKIKIWNSLQEKTGMAMTFKEFQLLIESSREKGTRLVEMCCHIHQFELGKLVVDLICTNKEDIILLFDSWTEALLRAEKLKVNKDKFSFENQLKLSKKIYILFQSIFKDNKGLPKTEFILLAEKCSLLGFDVLAEELMTINNPPRLKIRRYFKMKRPILALRETVDFPDSNYVYILLGELYLKYKRKGVRIIEKKIASLESMLIWRHWDQFCLKILDIPVDLEERMHLSYGKSDVSSILCDRIQRVLRGEFDDQIKCVRDVLKHVDRLLNLNPDPLVSRHYEQKIAPFFQFLARFGLSDLRYFLKHEKFEMNSVSASKVVEFYSEGGGAKLQNFEENVWPVIVGNSEIKLGKVKTLIKKGFFEDALDMLIQSKLLQVSLPFI